MTLTPLVSTHPEAKIRELNKEYTEALNRMKVEKKRGAVLKKMKKANKKQFWWVPIDDLGVHELKQLSGATDELKSQVVERADKLFLSSFSSMSFLPGNSSSTGMSSTSHSNMAQV
ncbi:hypothetical protein MKW94_018086 [Papaver nudicaule]|uniref:Agamous-like MADS-box protein AGL62 n=1 Tax=Papaver nudicaule TaxID=74823 RepID=A0AA41UVT2_PAPNU|nr:hypothetical protein [Papaver nudicaule]